MLTPGMPADTEIRCPFLLGANTTVELRDRDIYAEPVTWSAGDTNDINSDRLAVGANSGVVVCVDTVDGTDVVLVMFGSRRTRTRRPGSADSPASPPMQRRQSSEPSTYSFRLFTEVGQNDVFPS